MTAPLDVAVTGMGAVSALGYGCEALWRAVQDGQDGMRPVARFSTEAFGTHMGALVPGHDDVRMDGNADEQAGFELCVGFAVTAAREAAEGARLSGAELSSGRTALVFGTSLAKNRGGLHEAAERVAAALGMTGPRLTVSTACTSSTNAIGLGADLLRAGFADLVLAGGADVLIPEIFAGFHALGVLSPAKCAPFSTPEGTTLGEGAGFVVLESEERARRRGVEPEVGVLGYGLSADAFHETSPDPAGRGLGRAIRDALAHAGVTAASVGYVNAHGTGTEANDATEWLALQQVFGDAAATIPMSGSKSILGHAQGAGGVLELIVTLLARRHGLVPQTLHFAGRRPRGPADPVAQKAPRHARWRRALCTNAAFGGANAALVVGDRPEVSSPPRRGRVRVLGVGAVGGHGTDLASLEAALRGERAPLPRRVAPFDLRALAPRVDPRGLDPMTRYLTAAAALALRDGGVALRGALRDRCGLVAGIARLSPTSLEAFRRSLDRGLHRLSAPAFARMVLNAPTGAACLALEMRGPTSTLTSGPGSGLAAIVYAAELLATRDCADLLLAGGVDELPPPDVNAAAQLEVEDPCEGAAVALLAPAHGDAGGAGISMAGWAIAGPGDLDAALATALRHAGTDAAGLDAMVLAGTAEPPRTDGTRTASVSFDRARERLDPIRPERRLGRGEAISGPMAFLAGVLALRRGDARRVAVLSAEGRGATFAVVLARGE